MGNPSSYILPISSSTGLLRGGGFLALCSADSARVRFKGGNSANTGLTDEGVSGAGERAVSVVKGFSEEEAVDGAGLMLIFVFPGSADEGVVTGCDVDVAALSSMSPFSGFGFAGPDSFSMRRFRI